MTEKPRRENSSATSKNSSRKTAFKGSVTKTKKAYHKEKYQKETSKVIETTSRHREAAFKKKVQHEGMDPHIASKISQDLRRDILTFKQRHTNDELSRCTELHPFFALVPPSFIAQHMPTEVKDFSSYLPKFYKGSITLINGFLLWFEWASYEKTKGNKFTGKTNEKGQVDVGHSENKRYSDTRQALAKTIKEREHVRSLLAMCTRHNSDQRKAGQHAFINYLNAKLVDDDADCRTLEALKNTAHHSVSFALSRLILGMTDDNLSTILLNFHALYLVLMRTQISPGVILSVINEELAIDERMKACRIRLSKNRSEEDAEQELDPDDIADPTKGERNQRFAAGVFAMASIVTAKKRMTLQDAARVVKYLSYFYVEQKATRVISSNLLFQFIRNHRDVLVDEEAFQWTVFAFFSFPKIEYFRPEAVQYLLLLNGMENISTTLLPPNFSHYLQMDVLEPCNLEQICAALFRREQVTSLYPMIHPVWNDLIQHILSRCEAGESMKSHFTTFVHTVVIPYRRGNADLPRRALFQYLVSKLGQIAVRNSDAAERLELLEMASKNAGYGRLTAAKPSSVEELKQLPLTVLSDKVDDLIHQYRSIQDKQPASTTNRRWTLQELRVCLAVPTYGHRTVTYVDNAVTALLEFGFFPPFNSRDTLNQNRCIYLFADWFSFTYDGATSRPKCTLKGLDIIAQYLSAEELQRTRFSTALKKSSFKKSRNKIVEALEQSPSRSVLFYDNRDMEILLTLLFLILSVDDSSNSEAKSIAGSTAPDLVNFYLHGTIETIDLFFDVLMSLNMRVSIPTQVIPLMACVRRICTGYMLRFAQFIRSANALDVVLAPLREAYKTDTRELLRQQRASEVGDEMEGEEESGESDEELENDSDEPEIASDNKSDVSEEADDSVSTASTETLLSEGNAEEEVFAEEDDDAANSDSEEAEDEPPTQEYIDALKGMIGEVDLEHTYPTDSTYTERRDTVRAVQLAARIGRALNTPIVIHVYQVLLGVCRENVKVPDESIFTAALKGIDLLLSSKNRYYGTFVDPTDLLQVLGDIQSYCRKSITTLMKANSTTPKAASTIRYRMEKMKTIALRVFHFIAFIAHKNHSSEGVRIVLSEYYKSIFCDRGWNMKNLIGDLKQDIFYYRQGYVWALLPAIFEKYGDVAALDSSPQKVRTFCGCCTVIECLLPRLTRLSQSLKNSTKHHIVSFIQSFSLEEVFSMKQTLPYFYLHTVKMILKYNKRVGLDPEWVKQNLLNVAVENDDIKMTGATIRLLSSIEHILMVTPKIKETKAPVPMKSLFQTTKANEESKKLSSQSSKRVRSKTVKKFLASRVDHDNERSLKRQRREDLKVEDRLQRQILRESSKKVLSKEEREEKRKRIMTAKQERIAKNKERKRRLHELRQKSFERWRQEKIAFSLTSD